MDGKASVLYLFLFILLISITASVHAQPPALWQQRDDSVKRQAQPQAARRTPAHPVIFNQSEDEGLVCTTITYEGVGNLSSIPEFEGITSPGWLGIIDEDAGGDGNIAFEPSPETVAFWLGGDTGDRSSRDILVATPVSKFTFFYASVDPVRMEAFDNDSNLLETVTGAPNFNLGPGGDPNGSFNQWDRLSIELNENSITRIRVSGNVNQTGIDNLTVCRKPAIEGIEVTQAIQRLQTLEALQADLREDREPPVPIVAGKPATLRVYLNQVQAVTTLDAEIDIAGVTKQKKGITLQPHCTADLRRRRERGCLSFDFDFTPPAGNWTATVRLFNPNGTELESHDLPLSSRETEALILGAVKICDMRDSSGAWQCADNYHSRLAQLTQLTRKLAPTHRVSVVDTGDVVRRDTNTLMVDRNGDGQISGREEDAWWSAVTRDVAGLFGIFDGIRDVLGLEDRRYYGMAHTRIPGGTLGMASDIPGRGAVSLTMAQDLGRDVSQDTVAHELFHALGRQHTNTNVPVGGAASMPPAAPGCGLALDSSTDWPYPDNRIRSGNRASNQLEVGFDVARGRPVLPENNFDIMSYCVPVWISAHTYIRLLEDNLEKRVITPQGAPIVEGRFWQLSGEIDDDMVVFDPLFDLETAGPAGEGDGNYRIEIRDEDQRLLFTRFFTPSVAESRVQFGTEDFVSLPLFAELIPVQETASNIDVLAPDGALLGSLNLSGEPLAVQVTHPAGEETLNGLETLTWEANGASADRLVFRVQYSPRNGVLGTWRTIAHSIEKSELRVDFQDLPGSDRGALIRVLASDGVRTGVGVSEPFTVPMQPPTAEILAPADGTFFQMRQIVWLQGHGFDPDDGVLQDNALRWRSNLDGFIGEGVSLPLGTLSEGQHDITLTATDRHGNTASDVITIIVSNAPPSLDLTVNRLDMLPTTCVRVTIDAQAGSQDVPLSAVEYSLDAGQGFENVALDTLPFSFLVPGAGFFHLVVRAVDEAGQQVAKGDTFFLDSECVMQPPQTDASCTDLFGTAPEFILCDETATTCSFNVRADRRTCNQICSSFGTACVGAIDNEGSSCQEIPGSNDTCNSSRVTEICICERPDTPPPSESCTDRFGNAPGFRLCDETATSCLFNATTGGGTCDQMCRQFGSECIAAFDNEGSSCNVNPGSSDTCQTRRQTEICECEK